MVPLYRIRQEAGFTLTELLVVVAVIALLAAILFPVFAQAREKARQGMCLSNLRQIGLAMVMYLDDYDETYPGGPEPGPGWGLWIPGPDSSWNSIPTLFGDAVRVSIAARLQPYLKNTPVFMCPNDATGNPFGYTDRDPRFARASYRWQRGLSVGLSQPEFPAGRLSSEGHPWSRADVSRPALLNMVEDFAAALHSAGRLNICFADGHAKFSRFAGYGVRPIPVSQNAWLWNTNNPRRR